MSTDKARRQVRLLIADGNEFSRRGVLEIVGEELDMVVVGQAADGVEALSRALALRPDIVIADFELPQISGLELTRRLAATPHGETIRTILIGNGMATRSLSEVIRARVDAFLSSDCPARELVAAVRAVAEGSAFLSAIITRHLFEHFQLLPSDAEHRVADIGLSRREIDVVRSIGTARSNREIARELGVSEATVKSHVSRLLTKLDMRDRVQIALLAVRLGLVPLHDRDPASSELLTIVAS
ncbi:LuxR C-terminal-related transcriptional regulator [Streptomyces inhibens]|uniref:LuxR C-terminal-related transcriptional regulator n=1 Tax=Streptomyces inhibens TaxID=2293571 RepID=UPI0015F26389|nr:response regulator transcription factor [Streptomyces inhibens]